MSVLAFLGRIFIGLLFIFMGIRNFMKWDQKVEQAQRFRIPMPALVLGIGLSLEILSGAGVILGILVDLAALYLIAFTIATTYFFHNFWATEGEERMHHIVSSMVNLAIIGGLLLVMSMA